MSPMWSVGRVHLGRVRARLSSDDASSGAAAARPRLTRMLENANLRPNEIPPATILIVRHLGTSLPSSAAARRSGQRDADWQGVTRDALAAIYRRAVRVTRGPVPAEAEAVLFADESEMLAYLALDITRGEVRQHWWWQTFLPTRHHSSSDALTRLLCDRALAVPAALHHLAEHRLAVTVVEALSREQAMTVLSALCLAYVVPEFRTAADSAALSAIDPHDTQAHRPQLDARGDETVEDASYSNHQRFPVKPARVTPVPWEGLFAGLFDTSALPQFWTKEHISLLGVALGLYHAPALIRSSSFARSLRRWWVNAPRLVSTASLSLSSLSTAANLSRPAKIADDHVAGLAEQATPRGDRTPEGLGATQAASQPVASSSPPANGKKDISDDAISRPTLQLKVLHTRDITRQSSGTSADEQAQQLDLKPLRNEGDQTPQTRTSLAIDGDVQPYEIANSGDEVNFSSDERPEDGSQNEVTEDSAAETPLHLGQGVETQLGGVLFLINLMCQLGLLASFQELDLASSLGAWGTLEVLGRALLANPDEQLASDPLWQALAELDGRGPGELPGKLFCEYPSFQLPAVWLAQVPGNRGPFLWASNGERLRLWLEQEYLLLECPLDESAERAQALDALRAWTADWKQADLWQRSFDQAPIAEITGPLVAQLNPPLLRWLSLLLPYIRLRLQRALRWTSADDVNLDHDLLLRRGRLYITSTHVDLVMGIDTISVPVRMAALDCNPGWMPDFGRVVLFHFD